MNKRMHPFPFSAIVGQEDMKLGLILNIVDPKLGGILAFGEKGTAKSTAVRAIADLLPEIPAVKGCRFHCDPTDPSTMCESCREKLASGETLETEYVPMRVVDLPVSATEDRVVGTLDLEEAMQIITFVLATLLTATAVSFTGVIGFVGLVAPHITRMLLGNDYRYDVPASVLLGSILLLLSDTIARTIIAPTELPVGIVTSLIGVPFFLYLVIRRRRVG